MSTLSYAWGRTRNFWNAHVFILGPLLITLGALCVVAAAITLALVLHGPPCRGGVTGNCDAVDWNPNPACAPYGGVRSATSSDGYVTAVICRNGRLYTNPFN